MFIMQSMINLKPFPLNNSGHSLKKSLEALILDYLCKAIPTMKDGKTQEQPKCNI